MKRASPGPDASSSIDADIAAIAGIEVVPAILQVVVDTTGMRFACVARVTEDSWTACAVLDRIEFGLRPGDQLEVATTLCSKVRALQAPVVIDHASQDPVYCDHITPRMYGLESYLSFPLYRHDGQYFGSLCAIDPLPAKVSQPTTMATMTLLAQLISLHLDSEKKLAESRAALRDERETAELREQFIAVLGHDLRTPLASILMGAEVLRHKSMDPEAELVVSRIRRSGERISSLVDDVLDFTRGRMGNGIAVDLRATGSLASLLRQVVAELQSAYPGRSIRTEIDITVPVVCDSVRISQLLSNLLTNALVHGAPDQPVDVAIFAGDAGLTLTVTNKGPAIPRQDLVALFRPYRRGARARPGEGLGLGLYIVAEIARSHGGRVEVASTDEATCFSFTMPALRALSRPS